MLCAFNTALCFNCIPWLNRRTEFHIVKPCINRQFPFAHFILHQYTCRLSQYLAENNSGHNRIIRKMSLKEKFIATNSIMPDSCTLLIFCIVKKQHIIPVR